MLAKVTLLSLLLPWLAQADADWIAHFHEGWKRPIYLTCPTKKKKVLELVVGDVGTWDLEVIRVRFKGKKAASLAYDFAKQYMAPVEVMPRKAAFVEIKKLPPERVKFVAQAEELNRKVCLGKRLDKQFFETDLEMNRTSIYGGPAEPNAK